nr:hypothetical protein [Moritella viscosa]SHO09819.1 Probable taurine catabolism dioxygenase [Moritella viscosa]
MKIELLTPHIGALLHDVDLANCNDSTFETVYQAWFTHQVIFFREQKFSPQ